MLHLDYENTTTHEVPEQSSVQAWFECALTHADPLRAPSRPSLISVVALSEKEIADVNENFRGFAKPTNVLSFCDDDAHPFLDPCPLGEILFCPEVIEREAQRDGKALHDHYAHILIHGFLHLLGYDHIKEEDASVMEPLETFILSKFEIKNPYV